MSCTTLYARNRVAPNYQLHKTYNLMREYRKKVINMFL